MRPLIVASLVATLLTSCASTTPRFNAAPPLAALADPGPAAVEVADVTWTDTARHRVVPARIYSPATGSGPFPVIIFSHGLGNSSSGYEYLGRHWASYGFVSIHPNHAGADLDVTRHGLLHLYRSGFDRTNWRNVPEDIRFVIDELQRDETLPASLRGRIDRTRIGVSGHSLGAYASLAIGGMHVPLDGGDVSFRDERVRAAIPMSMSENLPGSAYRTVAIPMLHMTGTSDASIAYGTTQRMRRIPFENIERSDQYLLTIEGANHSTFSDDENAANRPAHDVIRIATILFWRAYLLDEPDALHELRDGAFADSVRSAATFEQKSAPLRVGTVTVHTTPLFSEAEAARGAFYRAADFLQIDSKEAFLRRILLFHEGDPYDLAKVQESERNLRALDFLKSAVITPGAPHDGVVDVTVDTQDAWTTDVNIDFSNDGGRSLYDFDVTQKNLLGRGLEAGVRLANGRERRSNSLEIIDPALFGPYWNADALLSINSDGDEQKLTIERPLFSYTTHSTAAIALDHLVQDSRIYADGVVSSLFRQQHREAAAQFGRVLSANAKSSTRIIGGFDLLDDWFTPLRGASPDDRHFRFIEAGIDYGGFDFISLDHIDLGLREQDFNLGAHTSFTLGLSPGASRLWRARADNTISHRFTPSTFVIARTTASARFGDTNRNAVVSEDARFVARVATEYPLTFVARARVDYGSDLDRDVQFFADGQNGLRAYPNFAFAGNRRFVLNAEQRIYLGHEWLQLFEPGAAVFADSGEAVSGVPFRLRDFRTDIGAGLRFGIARFESTMLRLDFAYALNDSPLSSRGFVVSFATTQAF